MSLFRIQLSIEFKRKRQKEKDFAMKIQVLLEKYAFYLKNILANIDVN